VSLGAGGSGGRLVAAGAVHPLGGHGLHDIPRISATLVNAPTWTFWRD
jgi:hypothetical protein